MKKREIIISLMIIMVGIITLGVGWQKYKKASAIKPNLIKCVAHIDENLDMSCDKCGAVLSFKEIAQYKELQTKTEGGALVEIKGEMPQNTQMVASEISKEKTVEAAQKYISSIKEEDIVNGFNIALKSGSTKYQPQKYNQNVDVSIENINIEDTKNLSLLHIINQNEYEIINPQINEKRINFKATSFSSYILINVANHNVKFNNTENYAVYTEKGREITNGLTMIEGENYTFVVKPKDGYGIGEISATTGTLNTVGDVLGKTAIIDSVTADTEITVNTTNAPTITKQPSNQKGKIGDIITFEIEAENTLYYEWEYKKITDTNWASVSEWGIDSSTSSITIPIAEEVRDVEVRCVLENAEFRGTNAVISNSANIIIAQGTLEDDFDVIDESNKMITEWTIPSDNTEIKLPVQGTGLNVTVDWGDGSDTETVTTAFPTHTYATAGTYEIKVWGTCLLWGYYSSSTIGTTSNYYTYTQYLTKVKQFGELNVTGYGFAMCENLIEVSGDNLVTEETFKNVRDMSYMFYGCSSLISLDLNNFDTSRVTNMSRMFYRCSSLTSLDLNSFDTSKVTDMSYMFYYCSNLVSLNVSVLNTSNVKSMTNMFSNCSNLASLNVSNFDTSKAVSLEGMFGSCSSLKSLDVSNFDTSKAMNMSSMFSSCSGLTNLDLSKFNTSNVTDMSYMFLNCSNLISLDVSSFDTSKVTSMAAMFEKCSSLTSLDVSNFDTSKVMRMYSIFSYCSSLTSLNISNFDTQNVGVMSNAFENCTRLNSLQLSNKFKISTSNMENMFANTTNLKSIIIIDSAPLASQFTPVVSQLDGKTFYVPNKSAEATYEKSWSGDFSGDRIQPILELVGDENVTINVGDEYTDAGYTVAGFDKANSGDYTVYGYNVTTSGEVNTSVVGKYTVEYILTRTYNNGTETVTEEVMRVARTLEVVDTAAYMITEWNVSGDAGLTITLPVSGTGLSITVDWGDGTEPEAITTEFPTHTYATAGVYEISVLGNCPVWGDSVASAPNEGNNYYTYTQYLSKVLQFGELNAWYYGFAFCTNLTEVKGATINSTKRVSTMSCMFYNCTNLQSIDLTNFDTSNVGAMRSMFQYCKSLTTLDVSSFDVSKVNNMEFMFRGCEKLESLNVDGFYPKVAVKLSGMFAALTNLKTLDISKFNTENVTIMERMFQSCTNLTSLNLGNINTSNVTNMASMFEGCKQLKNIDLSNFNTSRVEHMGSMFSGCTSLTGIDFSTFDTSNVTSMYGMFSSCTGLTSLNLSNFDTSNVKSLDRMFMWCPNLKNVNLSSFNTEKATSMYRMFYGAGVEYIDLSNFDTSNVTDMGGMFDGATASGIDMSSFDTSSVTSMNRMFASNSNLKSILVSDKFIISGDTTDIFRGCSKLTSVITTSTTPVENQFKGMLPSTATLYVPNGSEDAYRTTLSGDTDDAKIEPLLQLVGNEKTKLSVSEEAYTDAGYTVAGFTEVESNAYTCYGYSVTSSGEVNRSEAGIYKITYKITRTYEKDGQTITTEPYEVTREIEVEALLLEIPAMVGNYTYTGILQTLQLKNLDTSKMEIVGNTATNAGNYTATIKIKNKKMYAWKDGTTQDIKIAWEIKPIIAEITWSATTIVYDGTQKQITATVSNTVNGEIVTVTAYDGTIRATDVGEYTAKVKSLSSTNYTLEGALNTEKKWYIQVAVVDMQVIMQDYSYGGTLASPSITNNAAGRNVAYYYSTEDASTGGTAWSTVTNSLSIPVGTYYMYAIVEATQNYQETITDAVMFKVLATQLSLNMITEDGQSYQNEWTNQSVYITLTKNGDANVTAYQYKIGTSGSWIDQVTLPIVLENTTNDEIKVRGVNPAGRVVTEEVSAGVVKIDKTNPTIANITYKHENKILSVIFTLSDGQSGISAYAITARENMSKEWITSEEGTKQVEVSGSGIYYIWAKDKVGNIAYKTIKVIKDIIPPTAKITVKEAYTAENNKYYVNQNTVTISVDASDNQTAKAQIQMAIYKEADYKALASENDIVWEAYKLDNEWTVQKENAEEKVYVILKDLAGNITVKVGE